jgi:hypothetical protein
MASKKQVRAEIDKRAADNERTLPPILSAPPLNFAQRTLDTLKAQIKGQYQKFPIVLHFPTFYKWLASIPDGVKHFADAGAAVTAFVQERNSYTDPKNGSVAKLLDQINGSRSGQALLSAINATAASNAVHITPDLIFRLTGTPSPDADIFGIPALRHVTEKAMPIIDPDTGTRATDEQGNIIGSGEGTGDDSFVEFSPEAYVSGSKSRPTGPGWEDDEVLFHELVHASRQVVGAVYLLPVTQGYDNEEEYIAIVLCNIYIREKHHAAALRGDHGQATLKDPERFLDNVQKVDLEPRVLLERFGLRQKHFFDDLVRIDASTTPFNPVRQYSAELKAKASKAKASKAKASAGPKVRP